jgi:hypothetical protein
LEGKEDRRGKAHETYDGAGLVLCARLRVRQVRRSQSVNSEMVLACLEEMKTRSALAALLLSANMFGQQSGPTAASQTREVPTIHGVLIGQDGQPAKRVRVAALWKCPAGSACGFSPRGAVTDQNGEFRFNRVPVGKYSVFADDKEAGYGYAASSGEDDRHYSVVAEITPEHPDAEVRLFLPPQGGFLDVHLTDQSTGNEISTVTVSMELAEKPSGHWSQTTFERSSDCEVFGHHFCYVLIPPDTQVTVHVSSPGYEGWDVSEDATVRSLRIAPGDHVRWDVKLKPDLKWRALMQLNPSQLKLQPAK